MDTYQHYLKTLTRNDVTKEELEDFVRYHGLFKGPVEESSLEQREVLWYSDKLNKDETDRSLKQGAWMHFKDFDEKHIISKFNGNKNSRYIFIHYEEVKGEHFGFFTSLTRGKLRGIIFLNGVDLDIFEAGEDLPDLIVINNDTNDFEYIFELEVKV